MQKFAEILQRIAQAVRSMASAITTVTRTVMKPVFVAGRWTMEACTEVVMLPVKAAAAIMTRAPAPAPQSENAAQQTAEQIQAAAQVQEKALTAAQATRLVLRAARMRADGKDIAELADAIPCGLGSYIKRLNTSECHRLAETDASVVMSWISGKRPSLPGIRTQAELDGTAPAPKPSPKTNAHEDLVLSRLAQRLTERQAHAATYTPGRKIAA